MFFNSFDFLFFLPVVFILYWFVFNKSLRWQNALILFSSYFFYGWWSWKFMGLLMFSTMLDYIFGFAVASENRKKSKLFLWLSVINNLGFLGLFKYFNFFASQLHTALALIGIHSNPVLINVILPVGISFYTFHGMSYVFDIYRRQQKPVKSFIDYAVFVSFFPLLVAGPIERANHLLPQVQKRRYFNYGQAVEGCRLMLWGMFKKVVIADNLAYYVDHVFGDYNHFGAINLIGAVIAFSFQIYTDFSGYSDIAIGTSKLFGFELLSNFKFPYFSRDVAEFWRRWHISLSSWFRDYLYIPLGGSRVNKLVSVRNVFIIFIVSGFWHGASWNFITWGFLHACGFLPLFLLKRNRRHVDAVVAQNSSLPNLRELWQMTQTFIYISFAWIFFRAKTIYGAIDYIKQIVITLKRPFYNFKPDYLLMTFVYIIPLVIIEWNLRRNERVLRVFNNKYLRYGFYFTLMTITYFYFDKSKHSFIYFQF